MKALDSYVFVVSSMHEFPLESTIVTSDGLESPTQQNFPPSFSIDNDNKRF